MKIAAIYFSWKLSKMQCLVNFGNIIVKFKTWDATLMCVYYRPPLCWLKCVYYYLVSWRLMCALSPSFRWPAPVSVAETTTMINQIQVVLPEIITVIVTAAATKTLSPPWEWTTFHIKSVKKGIETTQITDTTLDTTLGFLLVILLTYISVNC